MADFISRQALLNELDKRGIEFSADINDVILKLPAIKIEPIPAKCILSEEQMTEIIERLKVKLSETMHEISFNVTEDVL